jgi:hypothetical protein
MTTEEQKTVLDLASHTISEEEFLQRFGIRHSEGRKLALSILEDAYRRKDGLDAEYGLYVGFHFGFSADHLDVLCRLSDADWHTRHEDVVTALGELRDKRTVGALYRAALKLHPYLNYDDCRALAVKAIWALGELGDPAADEKLQLLAQSDHPILRAEALNQLQRRRSGKLA